MLALALPYGSPALLKTRMKVKSKARLRRRAKAAELTSPITSASTLMLSQAVISKSMSRDWSKKSLHGCRGSLQLCLGKNSIWPSLTTPSFSMRLSNDQAFLDYLKLLGSGASYVISSSHDPITFLPSQAPYLHPSWAHSSSLPIPPSSIPLKPTPFIDSATFARKKVGLSLLCCTRKQASCYLLNWLHYRFDYSPDTSTLAIRMPTTLHEAVLKAMENAICNGRKSLCTSSYREVLVLGSEHLHFHSGATSTPDCAFHLAGASFPAMIIEVANAQTTKNLDKLSLHYIAASDGIIKTIIGVDLAYTPPGKEIVSQLVSISIWRSKLITRKGKIMNKRVCEKHVSRSSIQTFIYLLCW